jgi:TetR/AcrR family transcriptional regulator, cholesterol catabolism regulator
MSCPSHSGKLFCNPKSWIYDILRKNAMKEDKNKRRNNIAKMGAKLFSKKGFAETSMDDIAAAAKLSKGGIYHYFSSKAEVLYFILDNFMDVVLEQLREALNKKDNKLERVRGLIFCHINHYPKYLAEAKTLFHEVQNLPPKYYKNIIAKEREYNHITHNVLAEYFGPSMKRNQVTAMTFVLLGMCNSIYAYNPENPVSPKQMSQMIFDILVDGICGIQKKNSGEV